MVSRTFSLGVKLLSSLVLILALAINATGCVGTTEDSPSRSVTGFLALAKAYEGEFHSTMYAPVNDHPWRYEVLFLQALKKLTVTEAGDTRQYDSGNKDLERLENRLMRVRCQSDGTKESLIVSEVTVLNEEPPYPLPKQPAREVPNVPAADEWNSEGNLDVREGGDGRFWARVIEQSFRDGERTQMIMQLAVVDASTEIVTSDGRRLTASALEKAEMGFVNAELELRGDVVHAKRLVVTDEMPSAWPRL